jgi:hypothetical protein
MCQLCAFSPVLFSSPVWRQQWEAIEDKPTFLLYSGGAVVALWLTTVVVGAINSVPLVLARRRNCFTILRN